MPFNANDHIIQLKGKDYLEVKWRLVWFREDHPADSGWGITTQSLFDDGQSAIYHATITDPQGRTVATGTKYEDIKGFGDFREKAETGAIGRALATLGYGTQFAPDMEEGERLVDSPVQRQSTQPQRPSNAGATSQPSRPPGGPTQPGPAPKAPEAPKPAPPSQQKMPEPPPMVTEETVESLIKERVRAGTPAKELIYKTLEKETGTKPSPNAGAAAVRASLMMLTQDVADALLTDLKRMPAAEAK